MHHCEEPRAEVRIRAPQVELVPRPLERVLHEIVGARAITCKGARVSAQPGNKFDNAMTIVHGFNYPPARGRGVQMAGDVHFQANSSECGLFRPSHDEKWGTEKKKPPPVARRGFFDKAEP